MKHSQTGMTKVGLINSDGHAIGIDIGATGVRATILTPGMHDNRPSVTVHGIGQVPLPPGAVINGVVVDQATVTAALKQLWQANKFECRHVILGITNQQLIVRDMTVPNLNAEQRAKALPYQAREIVALPMDQVLLDFAELGEPDPETGMIHGLLIATPRAPVLMAVNAVEKAGLKVARVDLSSFAALRSIADEHLAIEAVIDIGAHLTNVVIHAQGVPKVVRTVTRGGQELTQHLADRASLSLQEAEAAKYQVGLSGTDKRIADALIEGIRPLLSEVRSSIHYFGSTNPGASLERISLTGGGAGLQGLADLIAEQVGLPTSVVTPMQHIRNRWANKQSQHDESDGLASAVSVGLAMGAAA
jgi:type IV pilus assembly protein PilM